MERRTYTIKDIMEFMGVSRNHAYRMAEKGAIPGMLRCGRLLLFSKAIIDEWLSDPEGFQINGECKI